VVTSRSFWVQLTAPLAALLAALEVALVWAGAPVWATIPVGSLMVLVLPGYAWWSAFRPSGGAPPLRGLLMTVTTSLGIVMVTGVALNALPEGLTKRTWAVTLAVVVDLGLLVALLRGNFRIAADGVAGTVDPGSAATAVALPRLATLLKCVAAAACVAAAVVISLSSQHAATASEHFTSLGLSGIRTESPVVTVVSHQGRTTSYKLAVSARGRLLGSRAVTLRPGAKVTESLQPYIIAFSGRSVLIKVALSVVGASTLYREVWFETAT
jgi:uncharacterized membrane protein